MTSVIKFFTRTQGSKKLTLVDWVSYIFLFLGFLIIFLPVLWLVLNSIKSQFLLQKLDTNLLPLDYERVGRATVYGPEGKEIFMMKDLPSWVLYWSDLSVDEKSQHDVKSYISQYSGKEYYALRTHFGLVPGQSKELIINNNLPEWLIKYLSLIHI